MEGFTCSAAVVLRQYAIIFDDEVMAQFVDNPLMISVGLKTNCRILLDNRVLNRSIRPGSWNRYFIINITGTDYFVIERCCRLIERHVPAFRNRERYRCKSNVTLYTTEWLPDNSPLPEAKWRMGPQRSKFANLKIYSPNACNKYRTVSNSPWKITNREFLGHYEFSDLFRPIYAKSKFIPGDYPPDKTTPYRDIAMFNWPTAFDRYTSYKTIDNETINLKLQKRCLNYIEAMKAENHGPLTYLLAPDTRQSTKFCFERCEELSQAGRQSSLAIPISKSTFNHVDNSNIHSTPKVSKRVFESSIKPNNFIVDINIETSKFEHEEMDENGNNQSNLISHLNQNFVASRSVSTKLSKRRRRRKLKSKRRFIIKLNRYLRLYGLRSLSKCIDYRLLENHFETESESEITSVSSCLTTNRKTSTKASKASNIGDNTLDSLKSL